MGDAPETLTICKKHDLDNIIYGGCECKDVAYYIRKDIAQKDFTELHGALKRKEYVLQPARDAMAAWDAFVNGTLDYLDSSTPWKAIKEILRRENKE